MAKEENEALKNCAACKKAIKKAKRYYRNGFNYCNKNCYKKKVAADKEKANSQE